MKTSISVVIPAYNEAQRIAECIQAIKPQLLIGDEIIVVDNNSTDQTAQIAQSLGARVIVETQQGISHARNAGFAAAKNQIIARTDADTIVTANWLSTIRDYYANSSDAKSAIITGPVYVREVLPIKLGMHQGIAKRTIGHETLVGGNLAMLQDSWQIISPYLSNSDELAEDVEQAIIAHQHGVKIVFLPKMIVSTSGRRVFSNPIRAFKRWHQKLKNTKKLIK